jgi:predicted porin
VGLAGGFGEITFGRRLNPMILNMIQNQILNSNSTTVVTAAAANAADFWIKNAITYTAPAMGGLTLQAQYAPSNIAGQDSNGTVTAAAARFVQGGLELHASMQDLSVAPGGNAAAGNTPATAAGKKSQLFGAKYTMGPLSFAATAFESKQNAPTPVAASLAKRDGYNVAVGYNFSKQLATAIQYTEVNNSAGSSASMVSLQARYALSPRSAIYGMGNFVSQGTAAVAANAQTILPAWGSRGSAAGLAGADQQALSVGVIHRF